MNKNQLGYLLATGNSQNKSSYPHTTSLLCLDKERVSNKNTKRVDQQRPPFYLRKTNQQDYSSLAFSTYEPLSRPKYIEQVSKKFLSGFSESYLFPLIIKKYFTTAPSARPALCKTTAKALDSIDKILLVLDWSREKTIEESYDSAVDLLSECGNILLKTVDSEVIKSLATEDIIAYEEKLEVLIKGIALSYSILPGDKLKAITGVNSQGRRLIKTMIIDCLLILKDEVNSTLVKPYLTQFAMDNDHDTYVKKYAQEALEDF